MGEARVAAGAAAAGGEHGVHQQWLLRSGGIEGAEGTVLGQPDHPFAQVAPVDDLDWILAVARHQHFPALRHPVRPVGESIGLVARSDDVAGTDDGHGRTKSRPGLGLAACLERAVQPFHVRRQACLGFGHGIASTVGGQCRILVQARAAAVGIDRDGGDEQVVAHLARQYPGRIPHPERQGGGIVDAHIPLPALQGRQFAGIAIAMQLLDLARPLRRRTLAAVEQRDLVAARQGVLDLERTGEAGAAQDQDAQGSGGTCRRGRGPALEDGGGGGQCAQTEQVATCGAHVATPLAQDLAGMAAPVRRD